MYLSFHFININTISGTDLWSIFTDFIVQYLVIYWMEHKPVLHKSISLYWKNSPVVW